MLKQKKKSSYILSIIFTVVVLSLIAIIQSTFAQNNETVGRTTLSPVSIISTRNNVTLNNTQLINSILENLGGSCPREIAIYAHGFWRDETEAEEEFNRVQTSLNHNNYIIPLIGISWDSKTNLNQTKAWQQAKIIAQDNGPKIAQFINDFKEENRCQNTHIRLIAHSLGAAVIDSTFS